MFKLAKDIGSSSPECKFVIDKIGDVGYKPDSIRYKEYILKNFLEERIKPIIKRNDQEQDKKQVEIQHCGKVKFYSAPHQVKEVTHGHFREEAGIE